MNDLLWRITRLRRRVALYLSFQHGAPNATFGAANDAIQSMFDEAAEELALDPPDGRAKLERVLWLTLGVVVMDPASMQVAAARPAPATPASFPSTFAVYWQRFIVLSPRTAIIAVTAALCLWLYAPTTSKLLSSVVPALISAAVTIAVVYLTPRLAPRRKPDSDGLHGRPSGRS